MGNFVAFKLEGSSGDNDLKDKFSAAVHDATWDNAVASYWQINPTLAQLEFDHGVDLDAKLDSLKTVFAAQGFDMSRGMNPEGKPDQTVIQAHNGDRNTMPLLIVKPKAPSGSALG